jgi:acetolactate decarboxylase
MPIKKILTYISLTLLTLVIACVQCPSIKNYAISQVGKYSNFIQGDYEGKSSISEVKKYGNFGIGAFDFLNGEMVALDGTFYQITSNGKVTVATNTQSVSYATVYFFNSETTVFLEGPLNFIDLNAAIDRIRGDQDKIYGLKITGTFSYLKLRSPKIQSKPYKKLKDIIDKQPFFEHKNIEGTLVGYYTPNKFGEILIPGYHFHFISKDKKVGGHVLDLNLSTAKLQFDQINSEKINLLEE